MAKFKFKVGDIVETKIETYGHHLIGEVRSIIGDDNNGVVLILWTGGKDYYKTMPGHEYDWQRPAMEKYLKLRLNGLQKAIEKAREYDQH